MRVAGIIAEYDPFHNGHAYHISETRAAGADYIVVVLGGHFTQRGEPALLTKTDRVRMALASGADLVIEMPQPFGLSSAEGFARGGIALLDGMGCVDTVSFGSECGDAELLSEIAAIMQTNSFKSALHHALEKGIPYAAAQEEALKHIKDDAYAAILSTPNNTLGLEYCKALLALQSKIQPFTVKRTGAAHNTAAESGTFTSAGHLRKCVRKGQWQEILPFLPKSSLEILQNANICGHCYTDSHVYDRILLAKLRTMSREQLASLPFISEGLENRLYEAIRTQPSVDCIIDTVKTKRYPLARLRRILAAAYLDLTAENMPVLPPYLRILGIGEHGTELLKETAKSARLPLFTDTKQPPADAFSEKMFNFECKASDLYSALLSFPLPCGEEFRRGMLRYPQEF